MTMTTAVAEKIRLVILTDEEVRKALRLEAAKRGSPDMSTLADEILREALAQSLEEVRKRDRKHHSKPLCVKAATALRVSEL